MKANDVPRIEKLITALKEKSADIDFYVTLLSIWNPEDEIFAKNYRFIREKVIEPFPDFDNDDNLWDNLPELSEQQMRKTKRMRLPKDQMA